MTDQDGNSYEEMRQKVLGLGESSVRKTYYPSLKQKQMELERFRAILDQINDIVFLVSYPDGKIVDLNVRATEKMGFKPADVLDKNIADFIFDDSGRPVSLDAMEEKAGRILIRGEIARKSDTRIPVEADLSFTRFEDEIYCAVVCRDISERLNMEKLILDSEYQYRTTIESITEGILLINSSGRSVIFNRAFADIYSRFTGEEVPDRFHVLDFFRDIGIRNIKGTEEALNSPDRIEVIEKVQLEGKMAVLKIDKIPIINESLKRQSVLIFSDITLNTVLDAIRCDVLYQINRNMEQFAILNDEIRNPLQALSGLVELKDEELSADIKPFINEIDMLVRKLDMGWLESEKVRSMIKKHYGVAVLEDYEMNDAVKYLKEFGYDDDGSAVNQ